MPLKILPKLIKTTSWNAISRTFIEFIARSSSQINTNYIFSSQTIKLLWVCVQGVQFEWVAFNWYLCRFLFLMFYESKRLERQNQPSFFLIVFINTMYIDQTESKYFVEWVDKIYFHNWLLFQLCTQTSQEHIN